MVNQTGKNIENARQVQLRAYVDPPKYVEQLPLGPFFGFFESSFYLVADPRKDTSMGYKEIMGVLLKDNRDCFDRLLYGFGC